MFAFYCETTEETQNEYQNAVRELSRRPEDGSIDPKHVAIVKACKYKNTVV
jgi:hypothetical protein